MAVYLVTGGAGFIGSHIAQRLVAEGETVRVLDNLSTGSLANLSPIYSRIEFIEGDVRRPETVEKALAGVDYLFHQAAKISVVESINDPFSFHETNVTATLGLLETARRAKVKRVVLASSSAVYGAAARLPLTEAKPVFPLTPYGMNKYIAELYAKQYYNLYGLETVCLRYFNVFGPGQQADSPYAAVIPKFIFSLTNGTPVRIFGDGEQTRDFVFVEDVVEANLLAGSRPAVAGEAINIAAGARVTVNRLYQAIAAMLRRNPAPEYLPPRAGEILHSQASIAKARSLLKFQPRVTLEEGLRRTVAWYQEQHNPLNR